MCLFAVLDVPKAPFWDLQTESDRHKDTRCSAESTPENMELHQVSGRKCQTKEG